MCMCMCVCVRVCVCVCELYVYLYVYVYVYVLCIVLICCVGCGMCCYVVVVSVLHWFGLFGCDLVCGVARFCCVACPVRFGVGCGLCCLLCWCGAWCVCVLLLCLFGVMLCCFVFSWFEFVCVVFVLLLVVPLWSLFSVCCGFVFVVGCCCVWCCGIVVV